MKDWMKIMDGVLQRIMRSHRDGWFRGIIIIFVHIYFPNSLVIRLWSLLEFFSLLIYHLEIIYTRQGRANYIYHPIKKNT